MGILGPEACLVQHHGVGPDLLVVRVPVREDEAISHNESDTDYFDGIACPANNE